MFVLDDALTPVKSHAGILDPSAAKNGVSIGDCPATRADNGIVIVGPPEPPNVKSRLAVEEIRSQGTTKVPFSLEAPTAVKNKVSRSGGSTNDPAVPVSISMLAP